MKQKIFLVFILAIFFLNFSCSKEFNNPIDPDIEGSVPPMPTDLRAFAAKHNSIELSFSYSYQNALGIIIYRNGFIHDTLISDTSYIDVNRVEEKMVYSYKICGYNLNGISKFSNICSDTSLKAPDTLSPQLKVTSHKDSAIVFKSSIRISGKIVDLGSGIKGIYKDFPATDSAVIEDSSWYIDVFLDSLDHKKMKIIFLSAIDMSKNETNLTLHILWDSTAEDSTPPFISVVEPIIDYSKVGDTTLNLILKIKDNKSGILFVTANGNSAGANNDSIFTASLSVNSINNDTTNIVIIAGDQSSNINKDTLIWHVIFDSSYIDKDKEAPIFIIKNKGDTLIKDTTIIIVDTFTVKGIISDPSGILSFSLTINEVTFVDLSNVVGGWSKDLKLEAYTNKIIFTAIDSFNNISRDTIFIFYDYQNKKPILEQGIVNGHILIGWQEYMDVDFSSIKLWVSSNIDADTSSAEFLCEIFNSLDSSYEYHQEYDSLRYYIHCVMYDSAGNSFYSKRSAQFLYYYTGSMVLINAGSHLNEFTITYDFYMDTVEVTQLLYDSIMKNSGVSIYTRPIGADPYTATYTIPAWNEDDGLGDSYPAYSINCNDAILFCNARSKASGLDTVYTYTGAGGIPGNDCGLANVKIDYSVLGFRLPTRDEWELAYRAGSTTDFYWGKDYDPYPKVEADSLEISLYAVWSRNSYYLGKAYPDYGAHIVAQKIPNNNGLYDMSGNLSEWCNDTYEYPDSNRISGRIDYHGPIEIYGSIFINGGNWTDNVYFLRASTSDNAKKTSANRGFGFRSVLQGI